MTNADEDQEKECRLILLRFQCPFEKNDLPPDQVDQSTDGASRACWLYDKFGVVCPFGHHQKMKTSNKSTSEAPQESTEKTAHRHHHVHYHKTPENICLAHLCGLCKEAKPEHENGKPRCEHGYHPTMREMAKLDQYLTEAAKKRQEKKRLKQAQPFKSPKFRRSKFIVKTPDGPKSVTVTNESSTPRKKSKCTQTEDNDKDSEFAPSAPPLDKGKRNREDEEAEEDDPESAQIAHPKSKEEEDEPKGDRKRDRKRNKKKHKKRNKHRRGLDVGMRVRAQYKFDKDNPAPAGLINWLSGMFGGPAPHYLTSRPASVNVDYTRTDYAASLATGFKCAGVTFCAVIATVGTMVGAFFYISGG